MVLPRAIRPPNMQRAKSEPIFRNLTRKICLKQRTSKLLGKARNSLKKLKHKGTKTLYSDFYIGPSTSIALSSVTSVGLSVGDPQSAKKKYNNILDMSSTHTSAGDNKVEDKKKDATESNIMNNIKTSLKTLEQQEEILAAEKDKLNIERERIKLEQQRTGRMRHTSV